MIGVAAAVPLAALTLAAVLDGLAATVGTRLILVSDVRLARDLELVANTDSLDTVLMRLVDRALMLVEVERFQPPDPPPSRVDAQVADRRARIGAAAWADALERSGVDEAYVRAYIRDDLRLDVYLRQRFGGEGDAAAFSALVDGWLAELRSRADVSIYGIPSEAALTVSAAPTSASAQSLPLRTGRTTIGSSSRFASPIGDGAP